MAAPRSRQAPKAGGLGWSSGFSKRTRMITPSYDDAEVHLGERAGGRHFGRRYRLRRGTIFTFHATASHLEALPNVFFLSTSCDRRTSDFGQILMRQARQQRAIRSVPHSPFVALRAPSIRQRAGIARLTCRRSSPARRGSEA